MRLAALALLGLLAACASVDEEAARTCTARGLAPDTPEFAQCIAGERQAYEQRRQRTRAAVTFAPPWTRFRSPGRCYPSPNTGVSC